MNTFLEILRRDFYIFSKRSIRYLLNYSLIMPGSYLIAYGIILPNLVFQNQDPTSALTLFIGTIVFIIFPLAFTCNLELLIDLENDKFINYQITIIDPKLLLLEKIIFSTFFLFIVLSIYFPICMIILTQSIIPVSAFIFSEIFLFLGALMTSSFFIASMFFLKNPTKTSNFWMFVCYPMTQLGGFLAPWYVMAKYSSIIGIISMLSPLTYLTEGLRGSILDNSKFFPLYFSALGLMIYSLIFVFWAFYTFKKKTDHI